MFGRVVGLDGLPKRANRGLEILLGDLAVLRGEVLPEVGGLVAGDVFSGEFGFKDGGGCGGHFGGLTSGCQRGESLIGMAKARKDASVDDGAGLGLRVGDDVWRREKVSPGKSDALLREGPGFREEIPLCKQRGHGEAVVRVFGVTIDIGSFKGSDCVRGALLAGSQLRQADHPGGIVVAEEV